MQGMLRNLSGRLNDRMDSALLAPAQTTIKSNGFVESAPILMPELNGKVSTSAKSDSSNGVSGHASSRSPRHVNGYSRIGNGDAHEHDMDKRNGGGGHKENGSLAKIKSPRQSSGGSGVHSIQGLLTALVYGGLSIASVFLNKAIFKVYNFDYPATLVTGQTLFSLMVIVLCRLISPTFIKPFEWHVFKRVGLLSMFFLVKIVLDMSALVLINIPMYGVLKTATTPFVMFLEYLMRRKLSPMRIQLPVYTTTLGGLIAGVGDLTFDFLGYVLALSSAMATAAYVVTVGKLGDELKLDSFTLLFYNCLWSMPVAILLVFVTGESSRLSMFDNLYSGAFLVCMFFACASAFALNWATYLCTLVNDSLTTSIVGRTKSIFQGIAGLFTFGDVRYNPVNMAGIAVNSVGVGWYAYEKYLDWCQKHTSPSDGDSSKLNSKAGHPFLTRKEHTITREGSQLILNMAAFEKELSGVLIGTSERESPREGDWSYHSR